MSDETHRSKEVEIGLPVIEFINEYSRLVSSIKKKSPPREETSVP